MQAPPPSARRTVKQRDSGLGHKRRQGFVKGTDFRDKKQHPVKAGSPAESGGGSPHQPGSKWSWGCASSERQPEVVRCPPKATMALPAGQGDQCGRKEAAGRCAQTYL